MTPADLQAMLARAEAARARADAATPGPWPVKLWYGNEGGWAAIAPHHEALDVTSGWRRVEDDEPGGPPWLRAMKDAALVSAARTDVPALAADVVALVAEVERLRKYEEAVHYLRRKIDGYDSTFAYCGVDDYKEEP